MVLQGGVFLMSEVPLRRGHSQGRRCGDRVLDGPASGERASRVKISSTVYGVRGLRAGGFGPQARVRLGDVVVLQALSTERGSDIAFLSLSRSLLSLSLPPPLSLVPLSFSPSLLQNSVVVVKSWSVHSQLGPAISNEGHWVPTKS